MNKKKKIKINHLGDIKKLLTETSFILKEEVKTEEEKKLFCQKIKK